MYDEPSWSMYRKQRLAGRTLDGITCLKIPTSPRGRLFSRPLVQVQAGGQLGMPRWFKSGWSRNNIGEPSLVRAGHPNPAL
jgi:hypothetical protein